MHTLLFSISLGKVSCTRLLPQRDVVSRLVSARVARYGQDWHPLLRYLVSRYDCKHHAAQVSGLQAELRSVRASMAAAQQAADAAAQEAAKHGAEFAVAVRFEETHHFT